MRAQADKQEYSKAMRMVLENQPGLDLKQAEVVDILVEDGKLPEYRSSPVPYTAVRP